MFIRPAQDSKFFHGRVMDDDEIESWRRSLMRGERSPVRASARLSAVTPVTYAPEVRIHRECRVFVGDGSPVAWSSYRVGGHTLALPEIGDDAMSFAREVLGTGRRMPGLGVDLS